MPSLRLYRRIPWFAKLAAKIVLARVPLPNAAWRRLGAFRHGKMTDVDYAYSIFRAHFELSGLAACNEPFTMLELGPGDSALSAVFAFAHGASRSILVDVDACATRNVSVYHRAAQLLAKEHIATECLDNADSFEDVLKLCQAEYHTDGLRSLAQVPANSIDFAWSQAVLEHVRAPEFDETVFHLRRIMKPGGIASHRVDLQDHLGGRLNNLRFSTRRWESPLLANSGFYTNRIRYGDMLRRFESAGFDVEVADTLRWNELPTRRSALHEDFSSLPIDDLTVRGFTVVLRPKLAVNTNAA